MRISWIFIPIAFLLSLSCTGEEAEKVKEKATVRGEVPVIAEAALTEEDLIGDWATLAGDAEYVTFSKSDGENSYVAYLRGRPLYSGTWILDMGKLTIVADNGSKTVYSKVTLRDGILELNDGEEKYERMVPKTGEEMVRELLTAAARAVPIGFSPVEPAEMSWNAKQDQDAEVKTLKLNGWRMSAEVNIKEDFTELNDLAAKASSFFTDEKGFVLDDLNVTEIAEGYTLGHFVVFIRVRSNPEAAENEPAFVDVISAYLP
ncbi:MAG TPA: hypothetical protein VMX75_05110 [Spirochaetia bacterium]|nr:hypothetical protein [Spirochaetia bacterium]